MAEHLNDTRDDDADPMNDDFVDELLGVVSQLHGSGIKNRDILAALSAITGYSSIIWADEMPPARSCRSSKGFCRGSYSKVVGENNRTGWLWRCTESGCPHTFVAA